MIAIAPRAAATPTPLRRPGSPPPLVPQNEKPVEVVVSKQMASPTSRTGVNEAVIGQFRDGSKVVFKHNADQGVKLLELLRVHPDARALDVNEIVASHIFHDELGLAGATYQQAYWTDASGVRHEGIATRFIKGLTTLEKEDVSAIKHPDEAVEQNVVKGWMGDWDIVRNRSNVWITSDGHTVAGDFGCAFTRGITCATVPKANQEVMAAFASRGNVEPAVERIRKLSDRDIRAMVDRTGRKWIDDWTDHDAHRIAGVLIHNRNELRRHDVYAHYYEGFHPQLRDPIYHLIDPLVHWAPEVGVLARMVVDSWKQRLHGG